MTYEEAVRYIKDRAQYGSKLGTERVQALLDLLGSPEKKVKFVHIAGTNGKGSVTTMIASILKEAGYKTGRYLSPYLARMNEAMSIDGEDIADSEFARLTVKVKIAAEHLDAAGHFLPVTEFEFVTALAFLYYYENSCDIVALEVGLGGRLDATNVIGAPLASVILSISFDHVEFLGDTLSKIAWEKCGIIKHDSTTVMYPLQDKEAADMIKARTAEEENRLIVPDITQLTINKQDLHEERFTYKGLKIHCPLPGTHQIYNCITAIEAVRSLADKGFTVADSAIQKGIENVSIVGRFEVLSEKPLIVIDGGHNVAKIESFAKTVEKHIVGKYIKIRIVMGMLKDKDYQVCIPRVAKLSDEFVLVSPDSKRALPAEEAYQIAKEHCAVCSYSDSLERAISEQLAAIKEEDALLVCGSLYLVGEARRVFRSKL